MTLKFNFKKKGFFNVSIVERTDLFSIEHIKTTDDLLRKVVYLLLSEILTQNSSNKKLLWIVIMIKLFYGLARDNL